jgi:subtilase family serine protease
MNPRPAPRLRHHRLMTLRRTNPNMEELEVRALLSGTIIDHPTFVIGPFAGQGPGGGFTPAQIETGYGLSRISFNGTAGTGHGETIAIVDAYNDPNIQSDVNTFDSEFSLPALTVSVVNETGGTNLPGVDSTGGWELEESLDVEWAHALAPSASITLVEASSTSFSDLLTAVGYAAGHANVVSMSWGGSEFSGETSYDSDFDQAGVAFVASSGDEGAPAEWPAASPNVLSVGGTALTLTSNNAWSSESGWSGSGGGPSAYESQPSYQTGVVTKTSSERAVPDVAYDASPSTGVAVYDSYTYEGETLDWVEIGGTSVGAPSWSALLAIADQGRVLGGESALNSTGPQQVMDILYQNTSDFHDITTGTSDGDPNYSAGPGYDYVTGLGTPFANSVASSLVGTTAPHDTFKLTASSPQTAGKSFSLTVTAISPSGTTDTSFTGSIDFTSTDPQASLPGTSSLDDGTATFTVTLKTAGSQTITATDTSNTAITGTTSAISVSPAAASKFVLSGLPSTVTAGVAQSFKVTAEDPYGNVATGYTGTVKFTSSDAKATLPGNSQFTSSNQGVQSFSVTFATAGTQSLTVTDTSSGISGTQSGISVAPAAATNLTATAVSSSQINLAWSASAGATGYEIERSLSPSSGFTEVGTATATTYSDTGLTAGTTYYYLVIATGGGNSSAASNTASATTTGTAPVTESLWGTSYKPRVNSDYDGSPGQTFELGVQFESNVAGEVSGVLFYKQRGMTGTNVGHLWSSNGTLLASATFTNETASGWQKVSFSKPVSIVANSYYTVSYTTGSPLFYYESGYFANGGVTNGNLTAPSSTDINGTILDNGVYNYGGDFPIASQSSANFWTDLMFSPGSGDAIPATPAPAKQPVQTAAIVALTPSQSSRMVISPPAARPAGPATYGVASGGAAPTFLGPLPSSGPIPQLGAIEPLFKKSSWWGE